MEIKRVSWALAFCTLAICLPGAHIQAAKKIITGNASANWAGYASIGKGYSAVSGSWVIPAVKPSNSFEADAAWIGIGGIGGSDLIQSGTEAVTENGVVRYIAWTEALPAVSKPLSLAVHAGDSISVEISELTAGHWQISFANNTTGQSTSKNIAYNSTHSSAEWIEEAPSDANGILPLDNFGSVKFNNLSATRNGKSISISSASPEPIIMAAEDGSILATPSALNKSGNSFSVTRMAAKSVSAAHRLFDKIENWTHGGHGIKKRQLHE